MPIINRGFLSFSFENFFLKRHSPKVIIKKHSNWSWYMSLSFEWKILYFVIFLGLLIIIVLCFDQRAPGSSPRFPTVCLHEPGYWCGEEEPAFGPQEQVQVFLVKGSWASRIDQLHCLKNQRNTIKTNLILMREKSCRLANANRAPSCGSSWNRSTSSSAT